jgi:multidrug efflux pump subunit AcrA (membrane-fusion protein)
VVLPREALRDSERVLVIEQDDRLFFRQVEVARAERQRVVVASGLEDGDRVCLSPLDAVTDGMKVRTMAEPSSDDLPALGE